MEVATIKRTAASVRPLVAKKIKIQEKIKNLEAAYKTLQDIQAPYEEAIKIMTGGFTTEDLVDREIVETPSGSTVRYVLKYPDTVVPPSEDCAPTNSDCNEETCYDENVTVEGQADNEI